MTTDRELDALLDGAAVVRDTDLPALPDHFLAELRTTADEPASVLAARQLVADAHVRRRPRRKVLLRAGGAVTAIAATFAVAVLVTPADRPATREALPSPTAEAPAAGLSLVAAEQATFPFSLDPVPTGLTATFSRWGGVAYYPGQPLVHSADYSSPDGDRVLVRLFQEDPRTWPDADDWSLDEPVTGTAAVTVDGPPAEVRGGNGYVTLLWERGDGTWVQLLGEGVYGTSAAAVGVAKSVVDRPQPVGLQFGLAPAGWSIGGYEESRSLDLVSDTDPQLLLRLSLIGREGGLTVDTALTGTELAAPVEPVTVKGLEGRLRLVAGQGNPDFWQLVGQIPDGPMFLLVGPQELTREQMLLIAEQVTYTP
ncbi:hypothetical protein DQ239_00375 [Blastococcus sp. TF02-09]|uniref:hypothetical protein n=1 Tax=Blastococcus sp. TF02-09 TaxID=2250576 RepID=UPI000DEAB01B|nr:hypothetical protein [Blastococcus sp. TF02-9]RBY81120.1 hypothetical protein DQ239_00375 [Blastococcus sp. TF02-9]